MSLASRTRNAVAAFAILTITGCASIVSESKYPIAVMSNPSYAKFEITNKHGSVVHTGVTPTTVTLKSGAGYFEGEQYIISFHRKGYADEKVVIDTEVSNWYIFGNIGFGGFIGWLIVDPATGAMFNLPPNVNVTMHTNDEITTAQ